MPIWAGGLVASIDPEFEGARKLARAEDDPAALIYGGERSQRRKGVAVYAWWQF